MSLFAGSSRRRTYGWKFSDSNHLTRFTHRTMTRIDTWFPDSVSPCGCRYRNVGSLQICVGGCAGQICAGTQHHQCLCS